MIAATVLLDRADEAIACETAERLVSQIAETMFRHDGVTMPLSVAIGVTMIQKGDNPVTVMARADQAIAMAAMFLCEHIGVRAIVAMTESGGTARCLSRFRSPVPIYGFSRHPGSRRRMALMRDVFPVDFDSRGLASRDAARQAVKLLFDRGLLAVGDRVVFTSGDHMERHGATNTLRLLQVGPEGLAGGLGDL